MSQVWKYPVALDPVFIQDIPEGAQFLDCQYQRASGTPQMWWRVDPGRPLVKRTFLVVDTGQDMPDAARYLATFEVGGYVRHLFVFEVL